MNRSEVRSTSRPKRLLWLMLAGLACGPSLEAAPVQSGNSPAQTATNPVTEARHAKALASEKERATNMQSAIGRAQKLVEEAKANKQSARLPLLERKLALLKEKADLLIQIAAFRREKWAAEDRNDAEARRSVDGKIRAAYAIIQMRQDEEKAIEKQLEQTK